VKGKDEHPVKGDHGSERRRHTRFGPGDMTVAVRSPSDTFVGKIQDISLGGLSVEYVLKEVQNGVLGQVDIWTSNGFSLPNLPCKVVYQDVVRESKPPFFGPEVRRCGIEFQGLAKDQEADLRIFLRG